MIFILDLEGKNVYIINDMSEVKNKGENQITDYQLKRFETLLHDIVTCCLNRELFHSIKFNLPRAELQTLLLFDGERYLTIKQISQKMEVTKSRITILIENLEKRKLVCKVSDPQDARVKLVTLTKRGREELQKINEFKNLLYRRILERIGEENRQNLLTYLEILRSVMKEVKEELWGLEAQK